MSPLAAKLTARIERDGPLKVADWMQACLADPEHGYYMTRDPFGRRGDFTTAPEISQMFGELLGLWTAVVWQQMGSPGAFRLVEVGPGRGTLMADALRATANVPGFAGAMNVHMVETSPALKAVQEKTLAGSASPVNWHRDLTGVPDGPLILIANEFLDALPARQLIRHQDAWHERRIDMKRNAFEFVIGEAVDDCDIPASLREAEPGSIFEVSDAVRDVTAAISDRLTHSGGAALLIDYGHAPSGLGDTLQALKGHGFADPLADPGEQDLTVHVDFDAAGRSAAAAGARVWGPLTQGDLLERLGIAARAAALLAGADKSQAQDIATARRRLVDTDAMGRLFKAMALTHPDAPAPPGFETVSWA